MLKNLQEFLESHGGMLFLVFFSLVSTSAIALWIAVSFSGNEKAFALFAGLVSGFQGSLLTAVQITRRKLTREELLQKLKELETADKEGIR